MKRLLLVGLISLTATISTLAYKIHVANETDRDLEVKFVRPLCTDQKKVFASGKADNYDTGVCALSRIEINSAGFTGSAAPLSTVADAQFLIELNDTADNIIITPYRVDYSGGWEGDWATHINHARANRRTVQANQNAIAALREQRADELARLDLHTYFRTYGPESYLNAFNAARQEIEHWYTAKMRQLLQLKFTNRQ